MKNAVISDKIKSLNVESYPDGDIEIESNHYEGYYSDYFTMNEVKRLRDILDKHISRFENEQR